MCALTGSSTRTSGFSAGPSPLQLADRLADHPHVQVEADRRRYARTARRRAGCRRRGSPGPSWRRACPRPARCAARSVASRSCAVSVSGLLRRVQEIRVGAFAAAADPAAQLVQLGQPVGVGAVDDEGVRVRDVQAGLDDRGRRPARRTRCSQKPTMTFSSCVLVHLPVRDGDPRLRHELGAAWRGDPVDRLDPVVHEEDLAVAQQLAPDGGGDLPFVVRRRRTSAPGGAPRAASGSSTSPGSR